MEKRKPFTLFGLPGFSSAECGFFILALVGISFTTFTVASQNYESVASTAINKQSVNEEHKITSKSSLSTVTDETTESGSVFEGVVGGTRKTKDNFETPNEKYRGISTNEQNLNADKLRKDGIKLNNIERLSFDIHEDIDVNYDYEIDVSGLPDELWGDYDDEAFDDNIDVETKQGSDYENAKNGYDNSITNLEINNIRTKNSFDIVDLDTFKQEDDWDESDEKSEYADMIDVDTHIDYEDIDNYDEYDEFYVDRKNSVLNMIDTDTHNEEDEHGVNHWSQVDGTRSTIDDMIDVTTFDENDVLDSHKWIYKIKDESSYDMIDTDTFEEQMENDEDCSDGYCLDYDEGSSDFSDMIDLGTKMEEIDINDDENSFYDMTDTEAFWEDEHKNGVKKIRHTSDFSPEYETKVDKMIRAMKEVEL